MENKIERVEDEKVYCYTYDSLVRELSKNMVVNEEMLLPKEGEESIGGHESIFNWIKAIDFEEGKTPAIEATFSSDGGKKMMRLDTEKQTPVGSLDEKVSKEELLYSMALTEAKMKVVSAIAEEVYPAVAFQISDYRKDMDKMRDEILENKSQVSNFNEVMHGALSRKNVVSAVVIATMLASSTGCVVATGTAKPIESTTNPAMTETFIPPTETGAENPSAAAVTELPTTTATEMPVITQTPEVGLSVENVPADLNFIDGRNVKEMASSVEIDANIGLEVALNKEGNIVAYNLKTENKDLWVVNPLIEKGFKWNFDTNENGQYILHNALEEWKYKAFPIEGIKFVKPDELPFTFWDESDPVRKDEKYPWPSEGSLAVFDGEGD